MVHKKQNLLNYITLPFSISPLFTSLNLLNEIISAFIPMMQALVTASFIDAVLNFYAGRVSQNSVLISLILLIAIMLYINISGVLMDFVKSKLHNDLSGKLQIDVVKKCANLEYWHIENNETLDLISRVKNETISRISKGYNDLVSCTRIVISILAVLYILLTKVWWAALLIIAVYIPLFFMSLKNGRANYEGLVEANKFDRKADYLLGALTSREYVEERSLFGYTKRYNDVWVKKYDEARIIEIKVMIKNVLRENMVGLTTIIVSVLIVGVLTSLLGSGAFTIGIFVGLATQLFNMIRTISKDLTAVVTDLVSGREFIKDLRTFDELKETVGSMDLPSEDMHGNRDHTISFVNVSFRYPGTEYYVLKNMYLEIKPKLHYAFVGINGAGKTTLIKLLTGLYDQYDGDILIDGKNLREYKQSEIKGLFSVVYQDFAKYYVSLNDSIMLGDIRNMQSKKKLDTVIEQTELGDMIKRLPYAIDTPVGKIIEDGIDLSGGEWQRVAIARSLVSEAPIRILDEPTAALDPVAESKVYELFHKISIGKSTIFITHRLGAAKLADEIVVIDKGHVAEQGSHDKLMQLNGIYAEMFTKQRSWYQ